MKAVPSQEHRLNAFNLRCLRIILGITWQDHVPNTKVLAQAEIPSIFVLLSKNVSRCLVHVSRNQGCRFPIPNDILYYELATGWNEQALLYRFLSEIIVLQVK